MADTDGNSSSTIYLFESAQICLNPVRDLIIDTEIDNCFGSISIVLKAQRRCWRL